ncbi:MAG: hypothetical protein QM765_14535 [Myxococcales bacterium]
MGYELLLRSPAPDQPVALEALVQKIQAAVASGIPAQSPSAPSAPSAPSNEPTAAPGPAASPAPAAAASVPTPIPVGPWTLKNGKGRVEVRLSKLEGADGYRGADFDIPFGGTEEELRTALTYVLSLASELQLSAFDPQLAALIGKSSEESVVGRWRDSQNWMVDTIGVLDDSRSVAPLTEAPPLINRSNKIILGILGALALLWWLWSAFTTPDLPLN